MDKDGEGCRYCIRPQFRPSLTLHRLVMRRRAGRLGEVHSQEDQGASARRAALTKAPIPSPRIPLVDLPEGRLGLGVTKRVLCDSHTSRGAEGKECSSRPSRPAHVACSYTANRT
jgi:hypothetical protein